VCYRLELKDQRISTLHSTTFSKKKVRERTNFKFVSEELGEGSILSQARDKIDNLDNRFLSFMTFSTFVL